MAEKKLQVSYNETQGDWYEAIARQILGTPQGMGLPRGHGKIVIAELARLAGFKAMPVTEIAPVDKEVQRKERAAYMREYRRSKEVIE